MVRSLVFYLGMVQALGLLAVSQNTSPDTPQPGSVEAIGAATTDPRFLSPWVSYLPDSKTVPSPLTYHGRIAGAAGELAG